jgi:hypothetical protein
VEFWIAEVQKGREDLHDELRPGGPPVPDLTRGIQEVLDHSPFESAPSIADILQVSRSTVLKHLHDDLGFRCFYLCWVPHLLTPELKEQRRGYAREIIPILEAVTKDGWHHFVTENKSLFFLSYSPRQMWTLAKDNLATKRGRDIQTAKFMFTVIWKPLGVHVIDRLPTGARMNSEYFTTTILARLEEKIFPEGRIVHAKRLIVHMDNCSIHTSGATEHCMKQNNIMRLCPPPCSRDLAPRDFYLFPGTK